MFSNNAMYVPIIGTNERKKYVSAGNQSVERGALILKALSEHGSLGVTEMAQRVGLAKSITYRLLTSLKDADLVRVEPKTRRYALGYGLLKMAADWLGHVEVRNVALPYLRQLRHETGETVALNLREGDQHVTIERLDTSFEVRFVVDLGRPGPMHIGAAGKAILAYLPKGEIAEIVARAGLSARQEKKLLKDLKEVQGRGFANTSGERVAGSRSVSAPIVNGQGVAIASISILSLQSRMQQRQAKECGRLVKAAAAEISAELGAARYSNVA